jgi:phosphate transport system permease protein
MSATTASPELAARLRGGDRRTRQRKVVNRVMQVLCALAAVLALAVLAIVVVSVLLRGIGAINLDFFTKPTHSASLGFDTGGVADAIVGTAVIVALATAMAVPVGVLVALYTSEFARKETARTVRLALDVLNGIPSIVIGIFVFGLLVVGSGQAAWKASFALAVIMLPLVARSTQEVLALVPLSMRDASAALGARHWKTVVRVVIPASLGGIVTGTALAIARIAGETAPILFTSSLAAHIVQTDITQAVQTLPFTIFVYSESPDPNDHKIAWAAALLLMFFVLVTSLVARTLLARSQRKLEGGAAGGGLGVGRLLGLVEPAFRGRKRGGGTS